MLTTKRLVRLTTPLCLDEGAYDDATMDGNAVTLGACQIVNIKVGRVGGLSQARLNYDWCRASGAIVV
ncbi:MAG TPA: hypothetical protein EYQ63_18110 [Fuerstia sp.]|nr:hypothetical protein [Fuerstiella sp.]